jgi:hypothetical protein
MKVLQIHKLKCKPWSGNVIAPHENYQPGIIVTKFNVIYRVQSESQVLKKYIFRKVKMTLI